MTPPQTAFEQPGSFMDRVVRPVARAVFRSALGKRVLTGTALPWLLQRPLADYTFVDQMYRRYRLATLPGDLLELGAWLGFGTARMAALARDGGKRVHAVDWFLVDFGNPASVTAESAQRYLTLYAGMTQRQVFDRNTRGLDNVVVHDGDISVLTFAPEQRFVLSVIDAAKGFDQNRQYVALAWQHTVPGGVVMVDDYGNPDAPELTAAVDQTLAELAGEIAAVHHKRDRRMVAFVKAPAAGA